MPEIDPEQVLEDLKADASPRKRQTLDLIHSICARQAAKQAKDFSIVTIGRLSQEAGGPAAPALRNKQGENYRRLIGAWAASQNVPMKKPISPTSSGAFTSPRDTDILPRIQDLAIRALVGIIIAERSRLAAENKKLKAHAELVIDNRPVRPQAPVEVFPTFAGLLLPSERDALEAAISKKFFEWHGWKVEENGRVRNEHGRSLYKPGYVTAIRKVLETWGEG